MTTIIRYTCVTCLSTLLFPVPVHANATPGFGGVSSLILLWLAVALFTAIGGGYVVRKKLLPAVGEKHSKEGILYTIVAVLSVLFSMSTVDTMMWAALVTGGLAVLRAVRMLNWSRSARNIEKKPIYLEGLNPSRMALASWLLIASTVILVPATITLGYQGAYTQIRSAEALRIAKDLRDWTAEEIKFRNNPRTEATEKEILLNREKRQHSLSHYSHEYILVESSPPRDKEFTIFLVPTAGTLLSPAISFRADQSGTIRAAKVYKPGVRCPEDGKVISNKDGDQKDLYRLFSL